MTTHETHEDAYLPPLEEVAAAYGDIREYNRHNTGLGVAMANMIKAMIEADPEEEGDIIETGDWQPGVQQRVTEGEMQAELQDMFHRDTFERIGVMVAPFGGTIEDVGKTTGPLANRELVPAIANTELFLTFLGGLQPEEVQADEKNFDLMVDVVETLRSVVAQSYGRTEGVSAEEVDALREVGDDALRTFVSIQPEYERLGLDKPEVYQHRLAEGQPQYLDDTWKRYRRAEVYTGNYGAMEEYVTYWGRNVLPEYLHIGHKGKSGSFSGYFDGGHRFFGQDADYLLSLNMDPRTRAFAHEVAEQYVASLDATLAEMDTEKGEWFNYPSHRKLLEETKARLEPMLED